MRFMAFIVLIYVSRDRVKLQTSRWWCWTFGFQYQSI